MTDLGTPGGGTSSAFGINDAGQVVGRAETATGYDQAFIAGPDGVGMTDLGTLGAGDFPMAHGINDAGQVVGWSFLQVVQHAFITGPNGVGMTDLNSLVSGSGLLLFEATGINNHG
jgi:probable HAF family extracellular repeat protein